MATRSLGTLTLDLIAKIGGFQSGLDQAARIADSRTKQMTASFAKLGSVLKGAFAGFTVGAAIHKFVEESSIAQASIAQLNAVLKSTGGAAGLTLPQLVKLSKEFQRTTVFSDEAVQSAEAILLQFNRLSGPEFERALSAITDISSRLGKDLQTAALQVAKALGGTTKGVESLRKVGVSFTKDQLALIKSMNDANDSVGIQRLVLKQIETAYKGAAQALRGTLGGAISGFKNQFNDLFELDNNQTAGLVRIINSVADNLELIAKVATRAAIAFGIFKAAIIAGRVGAAAGEFITLFNAVRKGNAVLITAASIEAAKTIATQEAAVAAAAETAAEVERTAAMVAGTRATVARVVADEASTASAATRATVIRNAAKAEEAFAAASVLHNANTAKVAAGAGAAAAAQAKLATNTSKLGGSLGLLLTPFRGIIAFAAANPFTAIAVGVGALAVTLSAFADDIKLSEDGVVNLGNASQAAFELTINAIKPAAIAIKTTFVAAIDVAKNALSGLAPIANAAWEAIKKGAVATFPVIALAAKGISTAFDAIEKRAREIAAAEELARKNAEAVIAAAKKAEEEQAASDEAIKKIKEMVEDLKKQNVALEEGTVAAIKYRIAHGDLKDIIEKGGAEAAKYAEELVKLTAEHERLEKVKEAAKKAEQAGTTIRDQIKDLESQIATYGKGEKAVFEYSLAHGDLAKNLGLVGPKADELRKILLELNDQLDKLKVAERLRAINLEILQLQGNTTEAITLKFDVENEELVKSLAGSGNQAGLDAVAKLRSLTIAQADFNDQRKQADQITAALARTEERFHIAAQEGAYTELEALSKIGDARKASVEDLRKIYDEMVRIAELADSDELRAQAEDFGVELEKLAEQTNLVGDQIEATLKDSFASSFTDFIKGTKSAGDAFKSFADAIYDQMLNLIAQNFAQRLFGGFSGSGFGGFISSLFSADSGGRGYAGVPRLIGTGAQPEVFVPDSAGTFIPNADQMGGGQNVSISFMLAVPEGGRVSKATQQQIAAATMRGLAEASRRNG